MPFLLSKRIKVESKFMQATIHLDDNLMQTAFQLSGIKTEQALIEQAVKELIKNYQARRKMQHWQKTISELTGCWEDFPNIEQLRADLILEQPRESL
jgi:Arc/MetJ family transcription regulator